MSGYLPEKLICLFKDHDWRCIPNRHGSKICRRCEMRVYCAECPGAYPMWEWGER